MTTVPASGCPGKCSRSWRGGTGSYGVALLAQPSAPVRVTIGGTANTDVQVAPATLDFTAANWATEQAVAVRAVEDDADALVEEPVALTHTGMGSGYDGARALPLVVTVAENDRATVSIADVSVQEDAGRASFEVSLSMPSTAPVAVDYATADGTAQAPGDYASVRGTLRFHAPAIRRPLHVPMVNDDTDEEETETYTLTISNVVNGALTGGASTVSAMGRIADNDDPRVVASFATDAHTVAEGGAPVTVTVRLDRDSERPLRIPLSVTRHGGATAPDYALPDAVTFAAGEVAASFDVTATDDAADDDGERIAIAFGELPDRVSSGAPSVVQVRIADDDAPGIVVPDPPTVNRRRGRHSELFDQARHPAVRECDGGDQRAGKYCGRRGAAGADLHRYRLVRRPDGDADGG